MFTRRGAIPFIGLGLLVGCGTEPGESLQYFPLTVGNTWTYAPEDPFYGQPVDWVVTERQGDTVALVRPFGLSHAGPVTLLDHRDGVELFMADEGFVPFYRFSAGASWVHRDPWDCDDDAEMVVVEETDTVITPAGTFRNLLRIERRTPASCADAGTMVEWWAPNVGLVRWEELNFYAGGPIRFELISYAVP